MSDPLTNGFAPTVTRLFAQRYPHQPSPMFHYFEDGGRFYCVTPRRVRGKFLAFILDLKAKAFVEFKKYADRRAAEQQVIRWHKETTS
jgi:hypothetical protein